jgi:hypothetical protein
MRDLPECAELPQSVWLNHDVSPDAFEERFDQLALLTDGWTLIGRCRGCGHTPPRMLREPTDSSAPAPRRVARPSPSRRASDAERRAARESSAGIPRDDRHVSLGYRGKIGTYRFYEHPNRVRRLREERVNQV